MPVGVFACPCADLCILLPDAETPHSPATASLPRNWCAGSSLGASPSTRGGSDTSLENNNVYGLEPKTYVEGETAPLGGVADSSAAVASAATASVTVLAVVSVAVAGTAAVIYFFAS